jgi:hypothetical protein
MRQMMEEATDNETDDGGSNRWWDRWWRKRPMMRQMRTQSDGQKHIDTQLSLTLNFYPVIYYSTCNKFRSTSTLADPNPNYIS